MAGEWVWACNCGAAVDAIDGVRGFVCDQAVEVASGLKLTAQAIAIPMR